MPAVKKFGDVRVTKWNHGAFRIDYGAGRGHEMFDSHEEGFARLDLWADEELSRLAKEVEAIAKLRRELRREDRRTKK